MNLVHELSALDSPAPCGCGSPWTAARRRAAACTSGSAARPRRRGTPPTRAPSGPTPPARSPPSPGRTHRIAATPSCDAETPSRQRLAASPNVLQIGMAPPGRIRGWFEGTSPSTCRASPAGPVSLTRVCRFVPAHAALTSHAISPLTACLSVLRHSASVLMRYRSSAYLQRWKSCES